MNRREFCRYLALTAAGAAALPGQVEAFEYLYDVNTRQFDGHGDIIKVYDMGLGFTGTPRDQSVTITFFDGRDQLLLNTMNHRACCRYIAPADCPLLTTVSRLRWTVEPCRFAHEFSGMMRYVDMSRRIHNVAINGTVCELRRIHQSAV